MSKLTLVPTPIGNLKDITLRAIEVLREADIILAEDTRKSSILLKHYRISKKTYPHHAYNEHKSAGKMVRLIKQGRQAALMCNAGTPLISDPGYILVQKCLEQDIPVECLPGPAAFIPAAVLSGLPVNSLVFEGFLPHKKGRLKKMRELAGEKRTIILYESPHRLKKTLGQLAGILGGERRASVSREMTKIHEETIRGTLASLSQAYQDKTPRGEFVLVIQGKK